ncbi:DUF222 domain-containing protein, partial [Williamsia limnetica]|uniref:DUF222 domain-containing protein n=1 Tax=Williamsia limnetica TaxID=882452 RepID=UPI001FEA56F7
VGAGLSSLDRTTGYFRDGFLSTEHVDAIVKGITHIDDRSEVGVSAQERTDFESTLLSHVISGAPPTEVEKIARGLGNQIAADTGGPPPAEDPSLNSFDFKVEEGRLVGRFDVDAQIAEKLHSALGYWSKPRPQPDGSADPRSKTQIRADAFHQLLDCGGGGGDGLISAPRTEVNVSVPADHPNRASLEWMGPITEATAAMLACDSTISFITLDGQQVPIAMSPPKRLFSGLVRKAIIIRGESVSAGMGRAGCSEERGSAATT